MKNGQFFMPMLTLLIVLSIIHAMWNILIQSYFYVDFKNSIIFATRLLIRKPLLSLLMIVLIFGDYVSLKIFPQYAILFIIPLTAYVLWKITQQDFDDLKEKVVIKN